MSVIKYFCLYCITILIPVVISVCAEMIPEGKVKDTVSVFGQALFFVVIIVWGLIAILNYF
jgi:hypothetical protein